MKQRFSDVFIRSGASLNETMMRIVLIILQSDTLSVKNRGLIGSVPIQNLFAFLLEYMRLFERVDAAFFHAVFSSVLKLYLTTHGDRCVGKRKGVHT